MLIAATIVITASAVGTFLILLWLRSRAPAPAKNSEPSILPMPGVTVSGRFTRDKGYIHVFFRVEERESSKMVLHILSEMGNTPLLGIRRGAMGQLEVGTHYFPIQVIQASLPWLEVQGFPNQAKPVRRDSLRVPLSFSIRFCLVGSAEPWVVGKGINISVEGLCFFTDSSLLPQIRRFYQVEIALIGHHNAGEKLALAGEMRWAQPTNDSIIAGLHIAEPTKQRELARLVSRLQHEMARHPEDYLLETRLKPNLQVEVPPAILPLVITGTLRPQNGETLHRVENSILTEHSKVKTSRGDAVARRLRSQQ